MNVNEWNELKAMMIDWFQTIYGVDLHHLCDVDGAAKPMRFNVGYDAAGLDCNREYEFLVEIPKTAYENCTSQEIANYIVSCFKSELDANGGVEAFDAPTEYSAIWCDEI